MVNSKINTFKSVKDKKPNGIMDFHDYLSKIKGGEWQDLVLGVRNGTANKSDAPTVTCSGTFTERNANSMLTHSGILAIDIDKDDNDHLDLPEVIKSLNESSFVYAYHKSIRGFGYVVYIKIKPDRHLDSFLFIEKAFANDLNIIIDKSCKDICRLRFISYDPDLYINDSAKTLNKFLPKKEVIQLNPDRQIIYLDSDIKSIADQIRIGKINLVESYYDWMNIGFAIAGTFGDAGEDLFHIVSAQSGKYSEVDCSKKYKNFSRRGTSKIPIDHFFNLCQKNGIEVISKSTKRKVDKIKNIRSEMPNDTLESIKSVMLADHNMSSPDDYEILGKVMTLPLNSLIVSDSNKYITEIETILKEYDIKFNEITRKVEINGKELNDMYFSKIYITLLKSVDEKFSQQIVYSIIDSIAEPFNPIIEWFQKNRHLHNKEAALTCMPELLSCFECENIYIDDNGNRHEMADFHEYFLPRWLCGVVSSAHGIYSLLILVLCGKQGVGKSEFFMNLLPDDLKKYCATSKLDRDKDDEILMTQKLILFDDEFGGKSKQDEKKLKALSSSQHFSVRKSYGRNHEDLQRIAVLGGTTNEDTVINDITGNRRIIPMTIKKFDIDRFKAIDKDLLWAEIYYLWEKDKKGWMLSQDNISLLNMATTDNVETSAEEELLFRYFTTSEAGSIGCEYLTTTDIANYILQFSEIKFSLKRLGMILKKNGYEAISKKLNGKPVKVYTVKKLTIEEVAHELAR